jgi:phage baseplate assembly protein W
MALKNTTGSAKVDAVIGVGISYPLVFAQSKNDQLLSLSSGPESIGESIRMILDTPKGSRVNNNEFGSDVRNLIFEPNDTILTSLLYYAVVTSVQRWERRITVTDVSFYTPVNSSMQPLNPNLISIVVRYIINATHQQETYVYPFVKNAMPMDQVIQGNRSFSLTSGMTKDFAQFSS